MMHQTSQDVYVVRMKHESMDTKMNPMQQYSACWCIQWRIDTQTDPPVLTYYLSSVQLLISKMSLHGRTRWKLYFVFTFL